MNAKWKVGSRFSGDPNIAYAELQTIKQRDGFVTAHSVLDAAREGGNPLNQYFEWNDTVAAQQHRLAQARLLIRSIEIEYIESKPEPVRAFHIVTVPDEEQKGQKVYQSLEEILNDPGLRAELLFRAKREMTTFKNKYEQLRELSEVFEAIDKVSIAIR